MATRRTNTSIKKIDAEIKKLQKQRTLLETKTRRPIIASVIKTLKQHNISIEELQAALGKRRTRTAAKKIVVEPKYLNKKTGERWSGRGRAPRWLAEAEAAGTPREKFLIKK